MNPIEHILSKYKLRFDSDAILPIEIPAHREDLAVLFNELSFKKGAEVGVFRGEFAKTVCSNNSSLEMFYGIDPYTTQYGYSESGVGEYSMYRRYIEVQKYLADYPCEILRKTSMEAVKGFSPNSLDFVYIDANHDFDSVLEDIVEWSKIVRPGGIMSGHDYVAGSVHSKIPYGVIEATQQYSKSNNIEPWFVFNKERSGSWFWVKP